MTDIKIEVGRFQKVSNRGNVRAFVSVTIAGLVTINRCKIIQEQGKRAYASLPVEPYETGKGYYQIIDVPLFLRQRIKETIEAAWIQPGAAQTSIFS
jgi:DNA-binding cell septation regulator SpoVG